MLSEYISSLPKEGKLSREEEARLWDAYKNEGELEARQKLIEHYQLLVFKEATKYPVQETVLLDLIQEGTVGLMEAAEKFDIEQGVAFSLYAIHRIRGRMLDFLRKGQNDILMGEEQEEKNFLHCRLHPIRLLKLLTEILCILLFRWQSVDYQ